VFIFGMQPEVYFESRRLPANRFLWVGPAVSRVLDRPDSELEALTAELGEAAPRDIILERHNRDGLIGCTADQEFDLPMRRLLAGFESAGEIEDFLLYRRCDGAGSR
jgi:hypothetical protein